MDNFYSSIINKLLNSDNFEYWVKFGYMLYVCYECDIVLCVDILNTANGDSYDTYDCVLNTNDTYDLDFTLQLMLQWNK